MAAATQLTAKQQFWHDHIKKAQEAGVSFATYAEQENLNLKAFYNYRYLLRRKGLIESDAKFSRLTPTRISTPQPSAGTVVRITLLNGICVDVPVNESSLEQLLQKVGAV